MEDYGQRTTGTRDEHYNLISVLYHALHGAENCEMYASDAEVAGDERSAAFFREARVMQTQIAERAKGLLGILESSPQFSIGPAGTRPDTAAGDAPLGEATDVPRSSPTGPPPPGSL